MSAMGQKRTNLLGHYNVLSSLLAVCYRSKIWLQGKEVMRVYKACIMLALVTGIAAEARAQSTESVVKLPSDMQFKAPVSPGPQTAVLYTSTAYLNGVASGLGHRIIEALPSGGQLQGCGLPLSQFDNSISANRDSAAVDCVKRRDTRRRFHTY